MAWRCPACGYTQSKSMEEEAKLLLEEKSDSLKKLLKQCMNLVNVYVYNSKMPVKYVNQFIYGISTIPDKEIIKGVRLFLDKEWYKANRNLAYLGGVIRNIHQTKESQIKAEKRLHGLNPPEIKKEK